MASSGVTVFTEPYQYQAAIRGADVLVVPTARSDFRAKVTSINFQQLWMRHFDENSPTVKFVQTHRPRDPIVFLAEPNQAPIRHGGIDVSSDEIVVFGAHAAIHHRTSTACRFGSMSLTPDDLTRSARALTGRDFFPSTETHRIRPSPPLLLHLQRLHAEVGRLASTAPDKLTHPQVARALEAALTNTMIGCLTEGARSESNRGIRHRISVMARLEEFLATHSERPLYLAEICVATQASERTIRECCREHLGMGPVRYLWLRRMHVARRKLLLANPERNTVTSIAMAHGFWELGRFSVSYRALFGETPSASLRRTGYDLPLPKDSGAPPVSA